MALSRNKNSREFHSQLFTHLIFFSFPAYTFESITETLADNAILKCLMKKLHFYFKLTHIWNSVNIKYSKKYFILGNCAIKD